MNWIGISIILLININGCKLIGFKWWGIRGIIILYQCIGLCLIVSN
jgi:hypothetical protein